MPPRDCPLDTFFSAAFADGKSINAIFYSKFQANTGKTLKNTIFKIFGSSQGGQRSGSSIGKPKFQNENF